MKPAETTYENRIADLERQLAERDQQLAEMKARTDRIYVIARKYDNPRFGSGSQLVAREVISALAERTKP